MSMTLTVLADRSITTSNRILGVAGETKADKITVSLPSTIGDITVSENNCRLEFQIPNSDPVYTDILTQTPGDSTVSLEYTIEGSLLSVKGTVWVQLCIYKGDNTVMWKSERLDLIVKEGINAASPIPEYSERTYDTLNTLKLAAEAARDSAEGYALTASLYGDDLLKVVTANANNETGAAVTIIVDNGNSSYLTTFGPRFDAKDVKVGLAVMSGSVGTNGYLTVAQLKALQDAGHEIYSHTATHPNNWAVLTEAQIRSECSVSQQFLKDNGFLGYNVLVYSSGTSLLSVKNIVREYYDYALSVWITGKPYHNVTPVDNFTMTRANGDTMTLQEMKDALDAAKTDGGWLIFFCHSFNYTADIGQKFEDFIDYCTAQDVPILPFMEAEKLKGNAVYLGDITQNGNHVAVAKDGKAKISLSSGIENWTADTTMDALLSTYRKGQITFKRIPSGSDTYFGLGGMLKTYNIFDLDAYAYQEFTIYSKNEVFQRKWNTSTLAWSAWECTSGRVIKAKDTGSTLLTQPLTFFTAGITSERITTDAGNSPSGLAGIYIVHRYDSSNDAYGWAEFVSYYSNDIYWRKWISGSSAWSAWELLTNTPVKAKDQSGTILTQPITYFNANCVTTYPIVDNTNCPEGTAGIYRVVRFNSTDGEHYGYAEFKPYNKTYFFRRYWTAGDAWSAWVKEMVAESDEVFNATFTENAWVDGASVDSGTGVFTFPAGFNPADGMPVEFRANGGTLPGGVSAYNMDAIGGAYYNLRDISGDTAKITDTLGGTALTITSNGSGWQVRKAGLAYLDITGLDLDTHKEYQVEVFVRYAKLTTANSNLLIRLNNDTNFKYWAHANGWGNNSSQPTANVGQKYSRLALCFTLRRINANKVVLTGGTLSGQTSNDKSAATYVNTTFGMEIDTAGSNITSIRIAPTSAASGLFRNGCYALVTKKPGLA